MNDLEICKLNRLPHMCGAEGARTDRSLRARLIRGGWLAPPAPMAYAGLFGKPPRSSDGKRASQESAKP